MPFSESNKLNELYTKALSQLQRSVDLSHPPQSLTYSFTDDLNTNIQYTTTICMINNHCVHWIELQEIFYNDHQIIIKFYDCEPIKLLVSYDYSFDVLCNTLFEYAFNALYVRWNWRLIRNVPIRFSYLIIKNETVEYNGMVYPWTQVGANKDYKGFLCLTITDLKTDYDFAQINLATSPNACAHAATCMILILLNHYLPSRCTGQI